MKPEEKTNIASRTSFCLNWHHEPCRQRRIDLAFASTMQVWNKTKPHSMVYAHYFTAPGEDFHNLAQNYHIQAHHLKFQFSPGRIYIVADKPFRTSQRVRTSQALNFVYNIIMTEQHHVNSIRRSSALWIETRKTEQFKKKENY